jgi:hypothetical protein
MLDGQITRCPVVEPWRYQLWEGSDRPSAIETELAILNKLGTGNFNDTPGEMNHGGSDLAPEYKEHPSFVATLDDSGYEVHGGLMDATSNELDLM